MDPWLALRNTAGVTLPLAAGALLGSVTDGLVVSTGALNVAFRDSSSPYPQRARHLVASSAIAGISVFAGAISGSNPVLSIALAALWAFAAGMLVALSQPAADLGVMSVVMLVVYGANPMTPHNAALVGVGAFLGGLLQTVLSVVLWPLRRYAPERRALGELYRELARAAAAPPASATQPPPATAQSLEAQTSLATLDRDSSTEGQRCRFLLSQAERVRLSLLALGRVRARLLRESSPPAEAELAGRFLSACAEELTVIAQAIQAGQPPESSSRLGELENLADQMHQPSASMAVSAMLADARFQMDALAGQLRSAADVAAPALATPAPQVRHWRHRATGTFATLRANLNLESTAFRHAIRLAASILIGESLGRMLGITRSYWIPMTIVIVLKPDFASTFSRGVLRLAGTFAGLVLATGLFHALPPTVSAQIAAIAALMFVVRCLGPAHYGILAASVSALVVFLVSLTGVSPKEVIAARAVNTAIGGVIALAAYWLWPTWERGRVGEALAFMLDAFRDYFRGIRDSYGHAGSAASLDRVRIAGRRARTNLEASIARVSSEPGVSPRTVALLAAMLASSHRLAQAMMSLEAAIFSSSPVPPRPAFLHFADDFERTLHQLACFLRGSPADAAALPDLREDHRQLVHAAHSGAEVYGLVNVETDRITNGVNTLSADVIRWVGTRPGVS